MSEHLPDGQPTDIEPRDATPFVASEAGTINQTPDQAALSAEASGGSPLVPGYEVVGELGRGGMGVVYRAKQLALDRDVAIKVLKSSFPADSPAGQRFLEEAHVTAQLQHPAIPAVHHVGELPNGRPYLVMKFVKGDTLADLLARAEADRGRFVAAFAQVCQAVAYAHSRKVIHRDLKPGNVMVGAFGEVQVMDWGLAKVLPSARSDPRGDETAVPHTEVRVPRADETQTGNVLGTPAYMSPEQAGGENDKVDERSDVFGLGAVLCTILTGQPPYSGPNTDSVRLQAIRGETAACFARLDASGADPELVAVCKRCLAADRAARPREAGEVAQSVVALLAAAEDRARRAELNRVRIEEGWKRRRVQFALAGVVLLMSALSAIGVWWYRHDRAAKESARRDRQAVAVGAALQTARALNELGLKQAGEPERWKATMREAFLALQQAEGLLAAEEPTDELRERVREQRRRLEETEADRVLGEGIEECLGELIELQGRDGRHQVVAGRLERLLRARGFDVTTAAGRERTVAWARGHPLQVSIQSLITYVGFWHTDGNMKLHLAEAATAIDPDRDAKYRRWLMALAPPGIPLIAPKPDELARLSADPAVSEFAPTALALLGSALVFRNYEVGILRFREWHARHPNNFWLNVQLAKYVRSNEPKPGEEALRYATAALALRPLSPRAHLTLAQAHYRNRDYPAAFAACDRALELNSNHAAAHHTRGLLFEATEKLDEAAGAYRRALELDPDLAAAQTFLQRVQKAREKRDAKPAPPRAK